MFLESLFDVLRHWPIWSTLASRKKNEVKFVEQGYEQYLDNPGPSGPRCYIQFINIIIFCYIWNAIIMVFDFKTVP